MRNPTRSFSRGRTASAAPERVPKTGSVARNRLGAALFHRHSGGVCLTFAGKRFLRRAYLIVRAVGAGAEDVAAIGRSEHGRVRIGIYSSIASGFLAELLRAYGQRHNKVHIDLIEGNPAEHVAAIPSLRSTLALAYLVLGCSVLGYAVHAYLVRHASPAWASSYVYVTPAVAVLLQGVLGA